MAGAIPSSVYPFGFKSGLVSRGMPVVQTQPGNVFWVSNSTSLSRGELIGSNGNNGTYYTPFATIAYALTKCLANNGDMIIVKPNHAETIANATGTLFNVAGVLVMGLGTGSSRPTLTFSAATSNIPITAANMSIQNFLFIPSHADVASVFTATGTATPTDFCLEDCAFLDTSSVLNFMTIVTGNATANSLDGLRVTRCNIQSLGTTAATTAIKLASTTNRVEVSYNTGVWAVLNDTAALLDASTFQITNFYITGNVCEKPNTSSTGGSFVSGSGNAWTGMASDNYFYQVDNSAGIWISTGHGTAFGYQNNFSPITGLVDRSGLINPAAT